jgi:hypothetical protein
MNYTTTVALICGSGFSGMATVALLLRHRYSQKCISQRVVRQLRPSVILRGLRSWRAETHLDRRTDNGTNKSNKHEAAQPAEHRNSLTSFSPDGTCRHWHEMSDSVRIGYLDGFIDGLKLGALHGVVECVVESSAAATTSSGRSKVSRILAQFIAPGIILAEMRDGITPICKRPENSSIGISDALRAFTMKLKGKPQSEIDDLLNLARQGVVMLEGSTHNAIFGRIGSENARHRSLSSTNNHRSTTN